jgi:hypothetical protein
MYIITVILDYKISVNITYYFAVSALHNHLKHYLTKTLRIYSSKRSSGNPPTQSIPTCKTYVGTLLNESNDTAGRQAAVAVPIVNYIPVSDSYLFFLSK